MRTLVVLALVLVLPGCAYVTSFSGTGANSLADWGQCLPVYSTSGTGGGIVCVTPGEGIPRASVSGDIRLEIPGEWLNNHIDREGLTFYSMAGACATAMQNSNMRGMAFPGSDQLDLEGLLEGCASALYEDLAR